MGNQCSSSSSTDIIKNDGHTKMANGDSAMQDFKPPGNPTNPGNCGTTMKARQKDDELPAPIAGQLRQYSMRFCPYSQRVRLVVAHKNINVEFVNINLVNKPDWYFEKNPRGTVPCIEQDDKILWGSQLIAEYLDDQYPGSGPLRPTDPYVWGRQQLIFCKYENDCVESYNTFFHGTPDQADDAKKNLSAGLDFINKKYQENGKKFFSGDEVGLLDYLIWPHMERFPALKVFIGFEALPKGKYKGLETWRSHMMSTPGVKVTFNPIDTHVTFGQGLASGSPPFDLNLEEES